MLGPTISVRLLLNCNENVSLVVSAYRHPCSQRPAGFQHKLEIQTNPAACMMLDFQEGEEYLKAIVFWCLR